MRACSTLFGIRPHSWEVLPPRKDDGVVRGPISAGGERKPATAAASKNAKRRQKKSGNASKREGSTQAKTGAGGDADGAHVGNGAGCFGHTARQPAVPAQAIGTTGTAQQDPSKKVRGLQKKLRQIAQLKQKQANSIVLEANQLSKIKGEASIRAQLEALVESSE